MLLNQQLFSQSCNHFQVFHFLHDHAYLGQQYDTYPLSILLNLAKLKLNLLNRVIVKVALFYPDFLLAAILDKRVESQINLNCYECKP